MIAKAWSDESFKERLLTDSRAVLEAEGISVPPGVDVKVVEQTDSQIYMIIPMKPASAQMELIQGRMTAGTNCYWVCCT
ncbi:MAG: NHLP leader peptide family RiPP precursor [Syntrophales bacterium]